MEQFPTPESKEARIERLITNLAIQEGMQTEDIISDIIVFAPHPENEFANPDYIEELAERLNISIEEMNEYALEKFNQERK
jgi:hypothetical protein